VTEPMARLISTVTGTDIVSVFWDDDTGLLRYRHHHFRTGFMVSVGQWLHMYRLQDEQGFKKKPHYTHTKTLPKVCVASRADIPELIRFVLANLETPLDRVQWGASAREAGDEVEIALRAHGFSLTADGHMVRRVGAPEWLRSNIE
jgi:hypothetical protein